MQLRRLLFAIPLLLPAVALADPVSPDLGERVNTAVAMRLGTLEIANASLQAQMEELRSKCGEPCKPPAPVAPAKPEMPHPK